MKNNNISIKIEFKLKEKVKLLYLLLVMVGSVIILINLFIITMIFTQSINIFPYLIGISIFISMVIINLIIQIMPVKVGVKEYKFYVVHIFTKKCVQITDRYSIQRKKIFWRDIYILESKEKGIKKMLINPILYKKGDILDQILANKINESINYLK